MAIVVSHIGSEFRTLTEEALRHAPLADLIELRLDRIGHPGTPALKEFFQRCPKPVIVSCNRADAFGTYAGSLDEQFQLLHDAAGCGARFVDIDWTLSLDLGEVEAPCHRIVSRHDPDGLPDDFEAWHEDVAAVLYEGDVTKLVPTARTTEDGLRQLNWLRTTKGIVSFCAGEAGSFTRILAPIFGSPFTYCSAAKAPGRTQPERTAPGQIAVNDLHGLLPPGGVSQETAILGVVGRPIGHSISPRVHGMALKAARLDAVYVAFEPDDFDAFFDLCYDENIRGLSITAPFKEAAFRRATQCDEASERTRAVNTLVRDGTGWRGANTDVAAVRASLERGLEFRGQRTGETLELARARVLVLGAGGAARAAAWAARSVGAHVAVASRNTERARTLASELDCTALPLDALATHEYDVLVHATPVGSTSLPGELPLAPEALRRGALVLDAVYRPIRTPLMKLANERGCTPIPGVEWFVRQAIVQFRLFTNGEPDEPLMRKAVEHALETDDAIG